MGMNFINIKELKSMMTTEQKEESYRNFKKFYPEGTPVIDCTSNEDGEKYLVKVDLKEFD